MSKPFTIIAALLLLAIAAAHAYRLYAGGFAVVVASHSIPMWVSWPAAIIAALLGVMVLVESRR